MRKVHRILTLIAVGVLSFASLFLYFLNSPVVLLTLQGPRVNNTTPNTSPIGNFSFPSPFGNFTIPPPQHGPIITETLQSGATLSISWLLKQGQNLSFTISTTSDGVAYTLDSPSRNLHKDLAVTPPLSSKVTGEEAGLYTLRLNNTSNFPSGITTHVVPNAVDVFVVNRTEQSESSTTAPGSLDTPEPLPLLPVTGTEIPVALIPAISGIISSGITAMTSIYLAKREKRGIQ